MWTRFILFILCVWYVTARANDELWAQWKRVHGKVYNGRDEDDQRRAIWEQHASRVKEHNLRHDMGLESYTMGLNRFADLSWEEFKDQYLSPMPSHNTLVTRSIPYQPSKDSVPESIDWREKGLVSPVRDQGACGSCWTFSTAGAIEGQYKKNFGEMVEFSKQQLVDCTQSYGNQGCRGGLMETSYRYIMNRGLESEADYPYLAREQTCQYNASKVLVRVKTFEVVHDQDENKLKHMVGTMGPVAVAIDVEPSFQLYQAGIYVEPKCSNSYVNHAVLAVGYGKKLIADYWIVKNSWGPYWGENGFIRMARNQNNMCGIATMASVPTVMKV